MKKYVILFSLTVILIVSVSVLSNYLNDSISHVDVVEVTSTTVKNSILCSGIIEYCDSKEVVCNSSVVANDIFVKPGDRIEKGDTIINVTNVKQDKTSIPDLDSVDLNNIDNINNIGNIQEVYSNLLSGGQIKNSENYSKLGDPYNIKASATGIVSSVNATKDNVINKDTAVVTIASDSNMQVNLSINESQISEIKIGQPAVVTGSAFKDSEYKGEVVSISNEAQKAVGTIGKETVVNVIVKLNNIKENLKPGYTAKCRIITSEVNDVLLAPYESIKADDDGKEYIYKYCSGKAVKTYINTGNEYQEGFQILSGLSIGDKIINKTDRLYNNCRVKINSMN